MRYLWRAFMDYLWDGYAMRYWLRCKQDQVEGGPVLTVSQVL